MRVLVTGATGFVGRALVHRLIDDRKHVVRAAVRDHAASIVGVEVSVVGDLDGRVDWHQALQDVDVVVHAAGRAHIMNDTAADPLAAFRRMNMEATRALAAQAAQTGVKRLVFLSSVKVNGEATLGEAAFTPDAPAAVPSDPYALSKWEAEQALHSQAQASALEFTIIRPPLVYGPGVKANFLSLMRWLWRGLPLPLGAINNRRSLVALDNLVDLIVTCLDHPAARNETFMVSDGEDLSTTDLLIRLSCALGRPTRLIPVPMCLLRVAAYCMGKSDIARRLCDSLRVDITRTERLLGWRPPVRVDTALRKTAQHWLSAAC